jgi:hypothetical protein
MKFPPSLLKERDYFDISKGMTTRIFLADGDFKPRSNLLNSHRLQSISSLMLRHSIVEKPISYCSNSEVEKE